VRHALPETPDVKKVTFELPDADFPLGLRPISAVMTKAVVNGEEVMRPYNPISSPDANGTFSLCVKKYEKAKMGGAIHALREGDEFEVKFGWRQFPYEPNMFKRVNLVAGGTGLTPCLQLIESVVANKSDKTKITLLYGNKTEKDIICKARLDHLAENYPHKFKVHYAVEDAGWFWKGLSGKIDSKHIKDVLPPPGDGVKTFVCGTQGMLTAVCGPKIYPPKGSPQQGPLLGMLKELGYTENDVVKL